MPFQEAFLAPQMGGKFNESSTHQEHDEHMAVKLHGLPQQVCALAVAMTCVFRCLSEDTAGW